MRTAFLLMAFCTVAVPAGAQEVSAFVREVDAAYAGCNAAILSDAPDLLALCEAADAAMEALQSRYPDAALADKDYVWFSRVTAYLGISEAYGAAENWPRFCEAAEHSWAAAGEVSTGSPEEINIGYVMPAALGAIKDCREFFPMPAWGRPLL